MSVALGSVTGNAADVHAVCFALQAVRPAFRTAPVTLLLASPYVLRTLERADNGEWAIQPVRNARAVQRLRDLSVQFPRLVILPERSGQWEEAAGLARQTAGDQLHTDTGTLREGVE